MLLLFEYTEIVIIQIYFMSNNIHIEEMQL